MNMRTALYRWYTKENGEKVRALQGKVFELEGEDIYYRDMSEHHGRMFKYDGSWNLDFRTYQYLRDHDIRRLHYYWKKDKKVYVTSVRKIASWIERNKVVLSKVNGHTQLFLPKAIFNQYRKWYPVPWINKETNIANKYVEDFSIPKDIKQRLAKEFRRKYA